MAKNVFLNMSRRRDSEIRERETRIAENDIFEDVYDQDPKWRDTLNKIMSPEQQKRIEFYLNKYNTLSNEMDTRKEEWEELQGLYKAEYDNSFYDLEDGEPDNFIPIIQPTIEGQIQTLDRNPEVTCKGQGFSDHQFAKTGEILTDWVFKKNKIRKLIKRHERRRRGYVGTAIIKVVWDPDAFGGFGMPRITCPSPGKVFVDGKIKDYLNLQKGDYIIEEIGQKSIMWLKRDRKDEYWEGPDGRKIPMSEIADAIALGNTTMDFDGDVSADDADSFTLLHVWTRNNEEGNLQLLELSKCGIPISISDADKPFYEEVDNMYPYFWTVLYEDEANLLYGFSDGKLMKKLQLLLNNLWNECELACRYSAHTTTFIDPSAKIDLDDYAKGRTDPRYPILAKEPNRNVRDTTGKGIDDVIFKLIQLVTQEAQRIVRFSSLLTGTDTGRDMTARQAGMELNEGMRGQDDKKTDLSDTLADVARYCLGLMMEHWDRAHAFRIAETDDFEWIDTRELKNIPVLIPSDRAYRDQWTTERDKRVNAGLEQIGDVEEPQFMELYEETAEIDKRTGKTSSKRVKQTKRVAFDFSISIGEGLPTNKAVMYNLILSLARLVVPDAETGVPKPILTYDKAKKMLSDTLGIDLDSDEPQVNPQEQQYIQIIKQLLAQQQGGVGQGTAGQQPMGQQRLQQSQQPQPVTGNPHIPNETIGGNRSVI